MNLAHPLEVVTPTLDGDVLTVLAGAEASFTGRQVHQVVGRHSERGIRNTLHRLCQQGIVTRERVGSSDCFTFNRAHLAAPHLEALAGLRRAFLGKVAAALEGWGIAAEYAALFGSAATGQMHASSDIDVLVVRPDLVDADDDAWRLQLDRLADDVTAWTGNEARVLELSATEVKKGLALSEPVLLDIRDHGIIVRGPATYLHRVGRGDKRGARRG